MFFVSGSRVLPGPLRGVLKGTIVKEDFRISTLLFLMKTVIIGIFVPLVA